MPKCVCSSDGCIQRLGNHLFQDPRPGLQGRPSFKVKAESGADVEGKELEMGNEDGAEGKDGRGKKRKTLGSLQQIRLSL